MTRARLPVSGATAKGPGRLRDRSGFALLEVLVAIAILAALASMVPDNIVAARRSAASSQAWLEARLVAERLIAEELSGSGLRAGRKRGTLEGRRWTVVAAPDGRLSAPGARVLLKVRLSVEVSPTETLTVDTARIGVP